MTNQPTPAHSGKKKTAEDFLAEATASNEYRELAVFKDEALVAMRSYAAHIAKLAVTEALKRASKLRTETGMDLLLGTQKVAILSIADEIDEIIKEVSE